MTNELSEIRNVKSPFAKVIAVSYSDGPIEGFVEHRSFGSACAFRLLHWDRTAGLRTYELVRWRQMRFDAVVGELFELTMPTWPVWVLPRKLQARGEALIDRAFSEGLRLAEITTADLFGTISVWKSAEPDDTSLDPAPDAPSSSWRIA